MAPQLKSKPRQQRLDIYNSTSTGHQVGSGVSKPAAYHKYRSAKLQQQYKSNQAPLTTFLASAKTTAPGSTIATNKGTATVVPVGQSSKTVLLPSSKASKPTRQIFAGCSIYINGSTAPKISDVELKRLLSHNGARISMALAQKTTTHVIVSNMGGGGLAAGKLQKEIAGKKNNIKYVPVQWALDSVAAGKRLPESRFSVLNLHAPSQKSLSSMISRVDNKENGVSP